MIAAGNMLQKARRPQTDSPCVVRQTMPTLPHASTPERAIEGHGQHSSRIIGLDLVRAAAIAMVLMAHMSALTVGPWPMTWVFSVGGLVGVEVFFALSGFLVGGILYRSVIGGTLSLTRF